MISMDSTLRDVYKNPVGRDFMELLFRAGKRNPALLAKPLVGSMRLRTLDKLLGARAPGMIPALVKVMAQEVEVPPPSPASVTRKWWKEAVVYQIYPRSFQDSNGDGIGDLAGIKSRIPYLKELGVDVVWLSPIYDSPNDDMGYDVRDYKKIMKEFGNMRDFNALLAELHKNDIKLIMDLVVNHTSDEHQWYKKALEDPDSPERDYYIWAKGQGGKEPNNWTSFFSGPAWNYDAASDEWALHLFSKKQMDLNWDNPDLRAEVYEMVRWWLEKGVDGFRMDVISCISKDGLADGNSTIGKAMGVRGIEHYFYGPRLHEFLQELRRETFGKYENTVAVGETADLGLEMSRLVTAEERGELDMVFNFDHLDNGGEDRSKPYQYDLRELKPLMLRWQQEYGNNCWPSLFFENHDNPRMVSKINPDPAWRLVLAKLLAVLQLTLRGTPFIYQGQELGMTNSTFESKEDLRDVEAKNRYEEFAREYAREHSAGRAAAMAFRRVAWGTRDHARTPMQWDNSKNAGFTEGEPWIGVNNNYPVINAENEQVNPDSVFNFFKNLIAVRRESEALVYGEFKPVFVRDANTFCYFRIKGNEKYYIEINLTGEDQKRRGPLTAGHRLVAGNYGGTSVKLRPYEANVYKLAGV